MLMFLRKQRMIPLIILLLYVLCFIVDSPKEIFSGYRDILLSPSILVTDYLSVGGLGATLFNVATILLLNLLLINLLDIRITGPVFAGLFIIMGFSFFGKNIINTLPIYLGIYIYSLIKKVRFQSMIIILLFSTGISPVISYIIFGLDLNIFISVPLGIITGIVIGLVLPPISGNTIKFHSGYNLYNIGFALGIISLLLTALLKAFNQSVSLNNQISTEFHYELLFMLIGLIIFLFLSFIVLNRKAYLKYPKLLNTSGRLITDYIRDYDIETVFLNASFIGTICLILVLIFGINLNGPIFGVIVTTIGFASFGKNPKNITPLILGSIIGIFVLNIDLNENIGAAMSLFLVTGLAPIAGRYGLVPGIISGFLHTLICPFALIFQGGFDLYNNGFAAGFIAAVMVPILETRREKEE